MFDWYHGLQVYISILNSSLQPTPGSPNERWLHISNWIGTIYLFKFKARASIDSIVGMRIVPVLKRFDHNYKELASMLEHLDRDTSYHTAKVLSQTILFVHSLIMGAIPGRSKITGDRNCDQGYGIMPLGGCASRGSDIAARNLKSMGL